MKIKTPTTAIILEERVERKDKTHPVKLRVTDNRQRRYYVLKDENGKSMAYSKKDFDSIMGERPRTEFKKTRIFLGELEKRAIDVISKLPAFTFDSFERKFFGAAANELDLFACLKAKASILRSEGRISTAVSYECTLNSLKSFTAKEELNFKSIDPSFLKKYEDWMTKKGRSQTTIGMYLRDVRSVYNDAKNKGLLDIELYPFGRGKYQIPNGKNVKKALTHQEVNLIASYKPIEGSSEERFRDYWLFSYLCNGMNIKDVSQLKYKDIDGDVITFVRAKTKRETKHNQRKITIIITPVIGRIIDKWGNNPKKADQFIFPILEQEFTAEQEYRKTYDTIKLINKYVKRIAKAVGITQPVTSYTARHSFATVLKRSGASTEFISESLGHSNLTTTENYLGSFEKDEQRKWANTVSNLLNP
jgi:integrase/recombinase XerD